MGYSSKEEKKFAATIIAEKIVNNKLQILPSKTLSYNIIYGVQRNMFTP
jgi:hypothetical protein